LLLAEVAVGDAALHCSAGPVDFCSFSGSGFGEHGQQDDDSSGGDVVADSDGLAIEVEPQLAEFAVELAREWWSVREPSQPTTSDSSSTVPQGIAATLSPLGRVSFRISSGTANQ
jgi:hypothetical protein